MRDIKLESSRISRINQEVDNLVVIGNWAKSCINLDQLKLVEKFLDKYCQRSLWTISELRVLNYHLGIVDGITLSLRRLKFKNFEND